MEANKDLPDIKIWEPIDSSQLSYTEKTKVGELARKAIDKDFTSTKQYVCNEVSVLKKTPKPHGKSKGRTINKSTSSLSESIINIQLIYNLDQSTEPDIWDGNFHSVSLHKSMEHIASDM